MKIFILALDGLEYTLVKKWGLLNLLQKVHGIIDVSEFKDEKGRLLTPCIWSAFITGKKTRIKDWWTYGRTLDWIRTKPPLVWIKGKRKLITRLGLRRRVVNRKDLNTQTIFEEAENSIALNVPSYNVPTEPNIWLLKVFKKKGLTAYEKSVWDLHKSRVKQTLNLLKNKNWSLFMTWFQIADLFGHIYIAKKLDNLRKAYFSLDYLASKLKNLVIDDDAIFLIVSDHGMMISKDGVSGDHSKYAFWSMNIDMDWRPKRITDFHAKILECMK